MWYHFPLKWQQIPRWHITASNVSNLMVQWLSQKWQIARTVAVCSILLGSYCDDNISLFFHIPGKRDFHQHETSFLHKEKWAIANPGRVKMQKQFIALLCHLYIIHFCCFALSRYVCRNYMAAMRHVSGPCLFCRSLPWRIRWWSRSGPIRNWGRCIARLHGPAHPDRVPAEIVMVTHVAERFCTHRRLCRADCMQFLTCSTEQLSNE